MTAQGCCFQAKTITKKNLFMQHFTQNNRNCFHHLYI